VIRLLTLVISLTLTSGCTASLQKALIDDETYVLASKISSRETCYTRIILGTPEDSVCKRGSRYKYARLSNASAAEKIPPAALGLFAYHNGPFNDFGFRGMWLARGESLANLKNSYAYKLGETKNQ